MTINQTYQRHAVLVLVVVVVAGLIAASDALYARGEEIIAYTEAVISDYRLLGMLLFVVLAMISAMLAFFSSAILVPIGIYAWGTDVCLVLLWVGWLFGGMVTFGIGRYLGRSVASVLIGHTRISDFEERLSRHAKFMHIVIFQAALPSEIPGYVLGTLRYNFPMYLVALAIVELPYAVGTVYLGVSFLERNSLLFLALGLGGVLLSAIAYMLYKRIGRTIQAQRTGRAG